MSPASSLKITASQSEATTSSSLPGQLPSLSFNSATVLTREVPAWPNFRTCLNSTAGSHGRCRHLDSKRQPDPVPVSPAFLPLYKYSFVKTQPHHSLNRAAFSPKTQLSLLGIDHLLQVSSQDKSSKEQGSEAPGVALKT